MALFEETQPAPANDGITYFGETDSRGQRVRFGIRDEDRTRHMYIIGQTGMGKSVLMENMAVQDVQNGNGFCFIDPHGSAIDEILNYIPEHRIKDVVYFAPFDLEYPISFNVMEDIGPDKRHLVAQGLLSAFKKIWGEETFSARMEHIVNNTLLALLEYPDTTILSMTRMLTERAYRDKVVEHISEPSVKAFWINEFGAWDDRYQKEAAAGVLNKVSQFVSNPLIRNIVGQPKSSFDFRDAMDNRKIVLINLSKGQVGEENSKLLGAMLTTKVYLAAMSRADVPKSVMKTLPYFYLYVDEFQTVVNDSFESILSEARKYKLSLIIAHQYIEQLPELVQAAVFGNVGTRINFRVGATDAEYLEKSFGEKFLASDIVSLSRFQVYLILMIDGVGSVPFSARTLPPIELPARSYREEVIASSRERYAGNRKKIEADIVEWMFDSAEETKKKRDKNRRKKSNKRARERGEPIPDRTGRGNSNNPNGERNSASSGNAAHKKQNSASSRATTGTDHIADAPIADLPGAASFKDAFANLVPANTNDDNSENSSKKNNESKKSIEKSSVEKGTENNKEVNSRKASANEINVRADVAQRVESIFNGEQNPENTKKDIKRNESTLDVPFTPKTVSPDSLRTDTKTYSVGAALRKRQHDHAENKAIHETGVVATQPHNQNSPASRAQSPNRFAFTFDESQLATSTESISEKHKNGNNSETDERKLTTHKNDLGAQHSGKISQPRNIQKDKTESRPITSNRSKPTTSDGKEKNSSKHSRNNSHDENKKENRKDTTDTTVDAQKKNSKSNQGKGHQETEKKTSKSKDSKLNLSENKRGSAKNKSNRDKKKLEKQKRSVQQSSQKNSLNNSGIKRGKNNTDLANFIQNID